MPKNKASLYQLSDPHREIPKPSRKMVYGAHIVGSWGKGRYVNIQAVGIKQAIILAEDECKVGEELIELYCGTKKVWDPVEFG